ncbi:endoglucanase 24-like [Rutidosis leptorrhynchoides]|uniref:endoglucanase 24-like n=1 Tax=Rutidosis leptorrhynchoides TaxID=125765 RepID=UPI003A9A3EDF
MRVPKSISMKKHFFFYFLVQFPVFILRCNSSYINYSEALSKSIMFFEGQRSGFLPNDQRMKWRGNSGLRDGFDINADLTGGYYDAGDNVKFGFPMAFTTTMLAWSVVEFGEMMSATELRNALVAIRWSTDYLLKTVAQPDRIVVQVGDPIKDHNCWERPEDMDTAQTVYMVQAPKAASDVAGETAAALAASSIPFRSSDPGYSETLLRTATRVFQYADTYRGAYSDNADIRNGACPYYCDFNGYQDELLWGAAWLRRTTGDENYLKWIRMGPFNNGKNFGADDTFNEFGWDNKPAGLDVFLSKDILEGNMYDLQSYKSSAERLICTLISNSSSSFHTKYTPGGLLYRPGGSKLQHSTTITFLMLVYANYLQQSLKSVKCGSLSVGPSYLRELAKRQADYILGDNPKGISYMVGYSNKYPHKIHHRGSSLPSIKDHPQALRCKDGTIYFNSSNPNPNVLVGALVGGPGEDDEYADDRAHAWKSEPTTYTNAPFVGVLAFLASNQS